MPPINRVGLSIRFNVGLAGFISKHPRLTYAAPLLADAALTGLNTLPKYVGGSLAVGWPMAVYGGQRFCAWSAARTLGKELSPDITDEDFKTQKNALSEYLLKVKSNCPSVFSLISNSLQARMSKQAESNRQTVMERFNSLLQPRTGIPGQIPLDLPSAPTPATAPAKFTGDQIIERLASPDPFIRKEGVRMIGWGALTTGENLGLISSDLTDLAAGYDDDSKIPASRIHCQRIEELVWDMRNQYAHVFAPDFEGDEHVIGDSIKIALKILTEIKSNREISAYELGKLGVHLSLLGMFDNSTKQDLELTAEHIAAIRERIASCMDAEELKFFRDFVLKEYQDRLPKGK